jgi:ADP-ribosyl-[dinitrogen reductase] hydrolase
MIFARERSPRSTSDDADTTGAVYGQLAGAIYGEEAIPEAWLERLAMRDRIVELADSLLELSNEVR